MTNLGKAMSYNIIGQALARGSSFGINIYLLRVIEGAVLGLVNVRLTLLYNTILFLTREPFRKANILSLPWPQLVNTIWLSPALCAILSVFFATLWACTVDAPLHIISSFAFSAFIESLAEPFAIISLRFSLVGHFAVAQSLLVILPKMVVFVLIFSKAWPYEQLEMFAFAQVVASFIYLIINIFAFYTMSKKRINELPSATSFRSFFPIPNAGLERESLKSVTTLLFHSVLKQFLTEGSAVAMTFTNVLSLKNQAVFDAVERLASLVARIVLAPLEETCFADFSRRISEGSRVFDKNHDAYDGLVNTFSTVLHGVSVIGLTVCVFAIPYSPLAVWLYGGSLLADNEGTLLMQLYSFYIYIMAINGITECLAMASMDNSQVLRHGRFLSFNAVLHITLNVFLCSLMQSSTGFIIANVITMTVRIGYSWRHISTFLDKKCPSLTTIFPNGNTFVLLVFSLFMTTLLLLLFGREPGLTNAAVHVVVGGVMFLLVSWNTYTSDHVMQLFLSWFTKAHNE